MRDNSFFDRIRRNRPAKQTFERGDAPIRNPTRDDQVEVIKVRRNVQGEPVTGNPA